MTAHLYLSSESFKYNGTDSDDAIKNKLVLFYDLVKTLVANKNENKLFVFHTAFLNSPIQISSTLENITDFELSVYCNDEILAINQDCAFNTSKLASRVKEENRYFDILEKELAHGAFAYALFNLGNVSENLTLSIDKNTKVRDLWAKEDLKHQESLTLEIPPHTAKIIKSTTKILFK